MKPRNALQKALCRWAKAVQLCTIHGLILTIPAKEIKKMKLRQIEKDLKALKAAGVNNGG